MMSAKKDEQFEINLGTLKEELRAEKKKVADMKIEKDVLAENLQDNMEYTAKKVEQFEVKIGIIKEALKSEKKKVDEMKNRVECPVCLEVPRKGPVFICSNGHLVCKKCKRESCPTCRVRMGDNKSLLAIAVIENILHECKYIECGEKFPLDNIDEHEKDCKHRVVACPVYDCDVRVSLSNLLNHLERSPDCCQSKTPLVVDGSPETRNFEITIQRMRDPLLHSPATTYCFAGHVFALNVNKFRGCWRFVIVMFESKEVSKEFNVEIEVYRTNSPPDSRHSVRVRCHPISIDQTAVEMEGFGLVVPHKFMEEIILHEGRFRFTVSFSFF